MEESWPTDHSVRQRRPPYVRLLALTIASVVVFIICNILSIIYDHLVVNHMVKLTLNIGPVKRLCAKLDNIVND